MSLPNSKVILEAQGIVKVLGAAPNEVNVLKGIDLQLQTGELTLLMGPSGSGKTTLLSILGCILSPTHGRLTLAGLETEGMNSEELANLRRKHVGFVFQSYNLVPTLSAIENIMLALDLKDLRGREAYDQAAYTLEAVGLSHRINAMPSKMSGGEKQRVSIARALSGSPSVILADEPTAALDAKNGLAVMELLAKVAQDTRRAVLAVTHDHRTLQYADRIITIEDGRISSSDRPKAAANRVQFPAQPALAH
jgi:putative ABC transport system ATP-binding protein